ncbi:phospholipase D family protein [Pseudaminobacter soli (ex Zhang et al. 2022)]
MFKSKAKGKPSVAMPAGDQTVLDQSVSRLMRGNEGRHGLQLLSDNLDAFAARALSARNAGRSLDLMYYIWKNDLTGRLLAHEVIAAADRGVRVRMLLDDLNILGDDDTYLAIDSHHNIEVRLFNPARARESAIRRTLELIWRAFSATRRMHNKAWIADGRIAIVGGRNIGDEYFGAARTSNFHDWDLLLVGPGVQSTESIFDVFWNSEEVLPIRALAKRPVTDLDDLKTRLTLLVESEVAKPYIDRIRERVSLAQLTGALGQLHWTDVAKIISDPPEKALGKKRENWMMGMLMPVLEGARSSMQIISPYFIPGDQGTSRLTEQVAKGVEVSVLTNSLAATDVAAVHGAYAWYRKPLVKGDVRLFELQPFDRRPVISPFGSSGASLHTKAFMVDGQAGFVGSFNFDPRSAALNTEMGILFKQSELISEMYDLFEEETSPQSAYRLGLDRDRLVWGGEVDGQPRRFYRDPEAGILRRLLAAVIGLLPIQSQL